MDPEQLPAIPPGAAEKAKEKVTASDWGDTAVSLDNGSQVVELAARGVGALWDGVCAVGEGVGAVCKAVGSVLPDID